MRIKDKISLLVYGLIILTILIWILDKFNTTENRVHKIIVGTIIIMIYLLVGVYILRKFGKYRKINKKLLRDSMIAGLIFGIVAFIFVAHLLINARPFIGIWYIPAFTSFLSGSFFWYLIFWDERTTVTNGIYVGILSILVSNILFWYFSFFIIEINKLLPSIQTLGFLDIIIKIMSIVITSPMWTMTMTLVSFFWGFMIVIPTIIIGGFTGGLIAYIYNKWGIDMQK